MVAPTLKRSRESVGPDPRNVARKLFQPGAQTGPGGPRPSISGSDAKLIRKPSVPKFLTKATSLTSQAPLRNVTNTVRGQAADMKAPGRFGTRPIQGRGGNSRISAVSKAAPTQPVKADVSSHPLYVDQLRSAQAAEAEATNLRERVQQFEQEANNLREKVRQSGQENTILREQVQQLTNQIIASESQHRAQVVLFEGKIKAKENAIIERDASILELQQEVKERDLKIAEGEQLIFEGREVRKKLHNTIQELKGNIRVIARVRGSSNDESPCFSFPDQIDKRALEVVGPATTNYAGDEKNKTFAFTFDKVFEPTASQGEVFQEISQLVQSALDGYKVTVFAYGQTGSGKTYTMEGPRNPSPETIGVIPRAVAQIFQEACDLKPRGWVFKLEATFVEIYLEEIRDLLGSTSYEKRVGVAKSSGVTTYESAAKKHEIHHGTDGSTTISNVESVVITAPSDVDKLLQTAAKNRSTAATKMNERSSRSHSVFTLRITGENTDTDQKSHGVLNLIDLAGSERLNATGVTGDRLKETQNINKSLACLGDVISALGVKKSHIPYRNSKLTYLLQNCLGGDGKTMMFVNIAPEASSVPESVCSLRFAAKVNACEIGTAKRKVNGQ